MANETVVTLGERIKQLENYLFTELMPERDKVRVLAEIDAILGPWTGTVQLYSGRLGQLYFLRDKLAKMSFTGERVEWLERQLVLSTALRTVAAEDFDRQREVHELDERIEMLTDVLADYQAELDHENAIVQQKLQDLQGVMSQRQATMAVPLPASLIGSERSVKRKGKKIRRYVAKGEKMRGVGSTQKQPKTKAKKSRNGLRIAA